MATKPRRWLILAALLAGPALAGTRAAPVWLGEQMPLPLAVKTPEDLAFKSAAERQYLVFNLLAGGKLAWDRGELLAAAERWEALLRLPGLPPELDSLVRPMAKLARGSAGGAEVSLPAAPSPSPEPISSPAPAEAKPTAITVTGLVTGGGPGGPGGAVLMLRRTDGPTPRPRASRVRAIVQKDKRFLPRVLAVPLGTTVEFKNQDEIFHDVFSLSKPNEFDLGLYKGGASKERVFTQPGPVQLLCNIHSSMQGWVYVSDTPWFTQADAAGRFSLKGVPPGQYQLEVWHEGSGKPLTRPARVAAGMEELQIAVDGDRRSPSFVPDKAGKPRQPQLGY